MHSDGTARRFRSHKRFATLGLTAGDQEANNKTNEFCLVGVSFLPLIPAANQLLWRPIA